MRYVPCGETFSDDKTIGRSFKNATFAEIDIQVFVDQLFESIDEIAGYIEANWDHRYFIIIIRYFFFFYSVDFYNNKIFRL